MLNLSKIVLLPPNITPKILNMIVCNFHQLCCCLYVILILKHPFYKFGDCENIPLNWSSKMQRSMQFFFRFVAFRLPAIWFGFWTLIWLFIQSAILFFGTIESFLNFSEQYSLIRHCILPSRCDFFTWILYVIITFFSFSLFYRIRVITFL